MRPLCSLVTAACDEHKPICSNLFFPFLAVHNPGWSTHLGSIGEVFFWQITISWPANINFLKADTALGSIAWPKTLLEHVTFPHEHKKAKSIKYMSQQECKQSLHQASAIARNIT